MLVLKLNAVVKFCAVIICVGNTRPVVEDVAVILSNKMYCNEMCCNELYCDEMYCNVMHLVIGIVKEIYCNVGYCNEMYCNQVFIRYSSSFQIR